MQWFRSLVLHRRRTDLPRIGYLVSGGAGRHPASAHVRVVSPIMRATAAGAITARQIDQILFAQGGDPDPYDVVLVQRDVIEPDHADGFLRECARRGVRLVVELDDDLVTDSARRRLMAHGYFESKLDVLRRVLERADCVVVSTAPLAVLASVSDAQVNVVPNSLDPTIWHVSKEDGGGVGGDPAFRILYAGSATHSADLELLREPLELIRDEWRLPVVLETVGVTPVESGWHTTLPIPDSAVNYPDFARWLQSQRHRWVMGVAPLAADPFNDAKSDLKFLEYSALGLATVASESLPYHGIEAHGGRLAAGDARSWATAVSEALGDSVERARRVTSAESYLTSRRFEPANATWLAAVLGR